LFRTQIFQLFFVALLLLSMSNVPGAFAAQNATNSPEKSSDDIQQLIKRAEQGNVGAQYNLGVVYADSDNVPQNYAEAVKWFRKAADQGLGVAQHNLGSMCASGEGFNQDYAEAINVDESCRFHG